MRTLAEVGKDYVQGRRARQRWLKRESLCKEQLQSDRQTVWQLELV